MKTNEAHGDEKLPSKVTTTRQHATKTHLVAQPDIFFFISDTSKSVILKVFHYPPAANLSLALTSSRP